MPIRPIIQRYFCWTLEARPRNSFQLPSNPIRPNKFNNVNADESLIDISKALTLT